MPKTAHITERRSARLQREASKSASEHLHGPDLAQSTTASMMQRMQLDPRSLSSGDILQLQRTIGNRAVAKILSARESRDDGKVLTRLPEQLKTGVEQLSGLSMSDVKVHRNSSKPAKLQAAAYTKGNEIHIGPGQEKHLPHEAWHVVQQKQGRVQPTIQLQRTKINDDAALEHEADVMGSRAAQMRRDSISGPENALQETSAYPHTPVVQGVFDWIEDAANNKRKVGVEITEDNVGHTNGVSELQPQGAWTGLAVPAQNALWTHTINLPDSNGGAHTWHVGPANTMLPPGYFNFTNGNKNEWMRWNSVLMTEDYGDFEWIIRHPSTPLGITYYRDQLANVNQARVALRNALNPLPGNEFVVALNTNPALGQVFHIGLQATNNASSQITFESTARDNTKRALMEGLTHGLDKRNIPSRERLVDPDPLISTTVSTAAARVAVANVDMELIMAFIVGDLCHKIATLISGPGWAGSIAANFKQWRTLFPKSHPSQIMFQAMDNPPTPGSIQTLNLAIAAQSANIIGDITQLFAQKLHALGPRVEWDAMTAFTVTSDPLQHVFNAVTAGTLPVGGIGTLQASLQTFCTQNGVNLANEFTNALTALTDYTGTAVDVVRSTSFATHTGSSKGFAFEDRAEVATQFPGLASTYARIKAVVNRY